MDFPKYPKIKVGMFAFAALAGFTANAQVTNPVTESIPIGDVTLVLEDVVTLPKSNGGGSGDARINHLKPDGTGRLFVNDLRGPLYIVSDNSSTLYLNVDSEHASFADSPGLGSGFTSFAFHPDFENNGKFYTSHSETPNADEDFSTPVSGVPTALQGVVKEWVATNPLANTFSGTSRELMRVNLPHTIHGMQEIAFNPNAKSSGHSDYGMLYICIGDGGSTVRGYGTSTHRLDSVLGTILRIDVEGDNSVNGQYGVPADNPWASDNDVDTIGEIWAYGFRNPHRIGWDTAGGKKMFSGEIGEKQIEEINLIEPGLDYGWNVREGTWMIVPTQGGNPDIFELPSNDSGFTYPVAQYDRDEGRAVAGHTVYRGELAPHIKGKYIFGEIIGGEIFTIDADSVVQNVQSPITRVRLKYNGTTYDNFAGMTGSRSDLRFGYDENDELYLTSKFNGKVYKVTSSEGPAIEPPVEVPAKLINISTRGRVGLDSNVLIGGFVIEGTASKKVLIQAVASELDGIGAEALLGDPRLMLVPQATSDDVTTHIINDDWQDVAEPQEIVDAADAAGATVLEDGSKSSGIVVTLDPGGYTVIVSGIGGTQGVALVEVYELED